MLTSCYFTSILGANNFVFCPGPIYPGPVIVRKIEHYLVLTFDIRMFKFLGEVPRNDLFKLVIRDPFGSQGFHPNH